MKKFVAIPLVAVMLAALAVPALAEETNLSQTGTGASFQVLGQYEESKSASTVYSVDIEWGSMKATYTKYTGTSNKWNPTTHDYDSSSASDYGVWKWETNTEGLMSNEIKVTNHSEVTVSCAFDFQPDDDLVVSGSFENTETGNTLMIPTGVGLLPNDPRLTKTTLLNLSGDIPNSYSQYKPIGTVYITISEY